MKVVCLAAGIVALSPIICSSIVHAQAVTAKLDTTMYMGHTDWSPYVAPIMCLQAVQMTEGFKHPMRGNWEDTLPYEPEHFSLSDDARAIARACGAQFTIDKVPAADLLDFAHLALMRGADDEAWRAAERYVASLPPGMKQLEAWYAVDTMFLYAQPMRLSAAEKVAARLDSLGQPAATYRAAVHALLLREAERRYDIPRMEREVAAQIAAIGGMPGQVSGDVMLSLLLAQLYRAPSADSAVTLAIRLLSAAGMKDTSQTRAFYRLTVTSALEMHMPPYPAKYWFGADSAAKTWPIAGKMSILIYLDGTLPTVAQAAMWRRLLQKFGSSVNVTFVYATKGHLPNSPPLEPSDEAVRVAKFILEDLKIPATVAVQQSPIQTLPDGRKRPGPPPAAPAQYRASRILTDRAGIAKLAMFDVSPEGNAEAVLTAWMGRETGANR